MSAKPRVKHGLSIACGILVSSDPQGDQKMTLNTVLNFAQGSNRIEEPGSTYIPYYPADHNFDMSVFRLIED